jgi:hypothetical protein
MRLLIALVVWVAAVIGAVAVSSTVAGTIHNQPVGTAGVSSGLSSGGSSTTSSSGSSAPDPSSIRSTDKLSLFRTANLDRALSTARRALGSGAQIDNFALYPGYLSMSAVKGGSEVEFYIDANGRVIQTATGGSVDSQSTFRLAQVGASVPAALAHRIATAGHVPESQLHYIVVDVDTEAGHKLEWLVYAVQTSRAEYFKASGASGPLLEYRRNSSTGLQPVSG